MKLKVLIKGEFSEELKRKGADAMVKKLLESGAIRHSKAELLGEKGTVYWIDVNMLEKEG